MRAGFILLRSGGAGSQAGVLSSQNHSVRTRSPSDLDRMITDCDVPKPVVKRRELIARELSLAPVRVGHLCKALHPPQAAGCQRRLSGNSVIRARVRTAYSDLYALARWPFTVEVGGLTFIPRISSCAPVRPHSTMDSSTVWSPRPWSLRLYSTFGGTTSYCLR